MPKPDFSKKFRILEDIATADAAFEIYGSDENALFENAALAVAEQMADTSRIASKIKKKIELEAETIDKLLYDFLSELVYQKDADGILFSKFSVHVTKNSLCKLQAEVSGDLIKNIKSIRTDVKAITLYMFKVEHNEKGWKARIVVDI